MKLKLCLLAAILALATLTQGATNDLTDLLQKGLFEEEANRDLNAAIANYQSLATAFDKDRQLAATAIFRLGECYRKLGKTNDAVVEYQRILKEFADQPTLVTLSRQNLAGLNVAPASASTGANEPSLVDAEANVASLQAQIQEIEKMTHDQKVIYVQQNLPNPVLTTLFQELNAAQQNLISLKIDYTSDHPKYKNAEELVNDLKRKADAQVEGTVEGLHSKLAFAQVQLNVLRKGHGSTTESTAAGTGESSGLENQYALLKAKLEQARQETNNEIVAEIFDDNKDLAERLRMELSMVVPTESMLDDAKARGTPGGTEIAERNLKQTLARVEAARQQIFNFQEIRLKALQSAIAEIHGGHSAGFSQDATATTDEEQQEIRRIQLMIQNSPDLINAGGGNISPLTTAASRGQLVVAKYLLDHGADVNGGSGNPTEVPLSIAADTGQKAMVELLLSRGADVDGGGRSPLFNAVQHGYIGVTEVLLAHHADVNLPSGKYSGKLRPIQAAARDDRTEMVKLLIQNGADVNSADSGGETALEYAVANNHPNAAKLLLAAKAAIDPKDANGETPLHVAAARGNTEMISLLLNSGASVDATNKNDATPLFLAVQGSLTDAARLLLEHKADPNRTGNFHDPNVGRLVARQPVFLAIQNRNNSILKLLLDAGANADTNSYIFAAIGNDNSEAVQLLLDHGADPNRVDNDGNSPLIKVLLTRGIKTMVQSLLAKGADANGKEKYGRPALALTSDPEVGRLLIEHKADVNSRDSGQETPLMSSGDTNYVRFLLKAGANPDLQNTNGNTALHEAVIFRGTAATVAVLLEHKANPNIQNDLGFTPLDLAQAGVSGRIESGMYSPNATPFVVSPEREKKMADLLMQAGGLANLPKRNRIEVRRASSEGVALTKGSRDWNRYSLLEMIACEYRLLDQNNSGDWLISRGPKLSLLSEGFPFPDLKNVKVYRRTDASAKQKALNINVEDILNSGERSRDVWLEWGDVVEIPETDHPVDQTWGGLTDQTVTALTNSTAREVTVVIKGASTSVKVLPLLDPPKESGGFLFVRWQASFMLRSVLDHSKLVRVSSDLSRVKVTRIDPETKKKQEWTIDCTNPSQADLWLRDGDVIEVPEK